VSSVDTYVQIFVRKSSLPEDLFGRFLSPFFVCENRHEVNLDDEESDIIEQVLTQHPHLSFD
jgi:hypothetical protein